MSWNPSDFSPDTMDTGAGASASASAHASTDITAHLQLQLQLLPQQQEQGPSTAAAAAADTTPQYTTVGSIYHPQPQPLQPPARRGRTVKSLFPYRNELPSTTHHHSHHNHHHQYSPLQQNFDRAMSPVQARSRNNFDANSADLSVAEQESVFFHHLSTSFPDMPPVQSPAVNSHVHAIQSPDRPDDASMSHEDTDNSQDGHNFRQMTHMNFKSLTNLASYPNPMQKTAQKMLSSHRPLPSSTNLQMQQRQQPWHNQAFDDTKEHKTTDPTMRNIRSDPLALATMLQSDSIDEHGDHSRHFILAPDVTPWVQDSRNLPYAAVLSKGPGAPAPLTAGPPGQRQYKPSTLESTISVVPQHGLQRPQDFDGDVPMPNPYNTCTHQQPPTATTERRPSPSSTRPISTSNKSNSKVVDTLTAGEASKYYPHGYPSDFNYQKQPICSHLFSGYPMDGQFSSNDKPSIDPARLANINRHFHSGIFMFYKEFSEAVVEKNSRAFARIFGDANEPKKSGDKIINRQLSGGEASAIPIEDHALPLISMTYQTLLTRLEHESSKKIPKFNYSSGHSTHQ